MSIHLPRLTAALALCAVASSAEVLLALPPLGLISIGPATANYDSVTVSGETAYLVREGGLTAVDSFGAISSINPSHPMFGSPEKVTRTVLAEDGSVYFVGVFKESPEIVGSALFRIDSPDAPITTWLDGDEVVGVLPSLVAIGTRYTSAQNNFESSIMRYFSDGTSEVFPIELDRTIYERPGVWDVTPNGLMRGGADIIGTIGARDIVWDGEGRIVTRRDDFPISLKDRDDGNGANADINNQPSVFSFDGEWNSFRASIDFNQPEVFQTEWVLTGTDLIFAHGFANRHGVSWSPILDATAEEPLFLRPLLEVFPDLPPMTNSRLIDAETLDGRFYLLFETDGQAYLYGGIDPSVVPEPTALVMCLGLLVMDKLSRRTRYLVQ